MVKRALYLASLAAVGYGQLAWWGTPIPKRDKPPVVFVTGHDALCPDPRAGELPFFDMTFGSFDKVMAADGRVSLVFESCYAPGRPPIEEIANVLRRLMGYLQYDTGERVNEVDVVAHSMGGLTVRAYLAGRQTDGKFAPPPQTPAIRKLVFIGTPHFGTAVATATDTDPQVRQMSLGHPFLFDLATWNQGTDDLRGIDALAIAGTAGRNGPATDSVATVSSASIDFAAPGRTLVLPYCHTQGGIGQLFLCEAAPGLARVSDANHPTAQLILSFLNDTDAWRTASSQIAFDPARDRLSGLMVRSRTADDAPRTIGSAWVVYDNGATTDLQVSQAGIAFGEMLRSGPARLVVDGISQRVVLPAGGSRALTVKPGPLIVAVEPAAGATQARVLAPGMLVWIRGGELNASGTTVEVNGKTVRLLSVSQDRILAVLPEGITGIAELRVKNATGQHKVRVLLEETFPVLFLRDGAVAAIHANTGELVSAADPGRAGEAISLFLSGLGGVKPAVNVAGVACELLYAGVAPTLPGVDQINCRLPNDLPTGSARLEVVAGRRSAAAVLQTR